MVANIPACGRYALFNSTGNYGPEHNDVCEADSPSFIGERK